MYHSHTRSSIQRIKEHWVFVLHHVPFKIALPTYLIDISIDKDICSMDQGHWMSKIQVFGRLLIQTCVFKTHICIHFAAATHTLQEVKNPTHLPWNGKNVARRKKWQDFRRWERDASLPLEGRSWHWLGLGELVKHVEIQWTHPLAVF